MKGNRAVLTAVVLVLVIVAGWLLFRRGGGGERIDLVERFATAEKRPSGTTFDIIEVTLNGETKRAINIPPASGNSSRLIWKVRVPDDAWLRVSVGMKPEAWDKEGDGVLFRFGVSDGRTYDPLFTQHVNAFAREADRRWIPVTVDLSAYAGEEVQLIFNTNSSEPGRGDDSRNDLAVWGAPEVIVQ